MADSTTNTTSAANRGRGGGRGRGGSQRGRGGRGGAAGRGSHHGTGGPPSNQIFSTEAEIVTSLEAHANRTLGEFASFGGYPDKHPSHQTTDRNFKNLAKLALAEDWGHQNRVLGSYIEHTWLRVREESKVVYSKDRRRVCFNTGLFSAKWRPIHAVFEVNKTIDGAREKRPYYFRYWCDQTDFLRLGAFKEEPERASYFDDPYDLLYDPRVPIIANIDHLLRQTQLERICDASQSFRAANEEQRSTLLEGATHQAKKRAASNIRTLVPQFFRDKNATEGSIQLILPIGFDGTIVVGLPLTKTPREKDSPVDHRNPNEWFYDASTVISLEMAYNNARLLFRIESEWLQAPTGVPHVTSASSSSSSSSSSTAVGPSAV